MLVLSGLVVAGCGESAPSSAADGNPVELLGAPGLELPGLDELPQTQRAAFEDGTITTAEYTEGFEHLQACANTTTELIIFYRRDPVSGYLEYGFNENDGGSLDDPTTRLGKCYSDEFYWIELAWQVSDPTFLEQGRQEEIARYANETLPCLLKNGIDAPATYDGNPTQEFINLGNQWLELYKAGMC